MGKELCFQGSTTPPPQGGGISALPYFSGFPSIFACTLWRITTNFNTVTHMGRGVYVSWGQPRTPPIPREQSSSAPHVWGFSCIYAHRTSKFGMVTHMGRGVFGSVTSLHLHKCVARFVRDSWVSCTYHPLKTDLYVCFADDRTLVFD